MSSDDIEYYRGRAETELEMARRAENPMAAQAHNMLAGFYLDRVHGATAGQRRDGGPRG